MNEPLAFDKIIFWINQYGHPEVEDKRAMENFVICEGSEILNATIAQLHTISKGHYNEEIMDKVVGKKRVVRHGSYEEWARLMLLWLNEARSRS